MVKHFHYKLNNLYIQLSTAVGAIVIAGLLDKRPVHVNLVSKLKYESSLLCDKQLSAHNLCTKVNKDTSRNEIHKIHIRVSFCKGEN